MSEEKKSKFSGLTNVVGNVTKSTASTLGQATKKAASTVAKNVKESSEQLGKQLDQKLFENDRKRLCPIFHEDILSGNFMLPPLLRVVGYDKRRDNRACDGAVGFMTGKDAKLLNIYREHIDLLHLSFYPFLEEGVYYVDPCFNTLFIKIEDYFAYLKKVRVDELTKIAQDLGAKHVEITLKSNQTSLKNQSMTSSANVFKTGGSASVQKSNNNYSGIEVAAKIDFKGNDSPVRPSLVYFKNESDINALIEMRLNPQSGNQIVSKTYSLQYGNSSGIKIGDAEKIDNALRNVNFQMSRSFTNEVMSESNTILEYTILF